jgi:hypothetical protein
MEKRKDMEEGEGGRQAGAMRNQGESRGGYIEVRSKRNGGRGGIYLKAPPIITS